MVDPDGRITEDFSQAAACFKKQLFPLWIVLGDSPLVFHLGFTSPVVWMVGEMLIRSGQDARR
jgi:hypothetical protein